MSKFYIKAFWDGGSVYLSNGDLIGYLTDQQAEENRVSSSEDVKILRKLKEAGFSAEEIVELRQGGLV